MAEINQLPIQESEPLSDSESRILSLIEASKKISHFSTTLINDVPPSSEVEFGYYAELSEAKDVNEFEQKIDASIKALGFDEFSYYRTAGVGQDPQKLINISSSMVSDYYTERLYEQDLILTYANKNTNPIFQTILYDYASLSPVDTEMSRAMKALCKLNNSYGYYDFYNSFAPARNGNGNVMLSVTNRGCNPIILRNLVAECKSTLQVLCEAIDFVASRKFASILLSTSAEDTANIVINPRPLKVLDTLANNDFNIAQVAEYLCISTVTANKHLEAARRAFGAKTNYYAIKQAVLNGLIDYRK
jgi:DNA-binding CsgD family transcriptional regulator